MVINVNQQSCGNSSKTCKNGMDWNGTYKELFVAGLHGPKIEIKSNRIITTLFGKQLNVYLYIPPNLVNHQE